MAMHHDTIAAGERGLVGRNRHSRIPPGAPMAEYGFAYSALRFPCSLSMTTSFRIETHVLS